MALLSNKIRKETKKRELQEGYLSQLERIKIQNELIIKHLEKTKLKA